MTSRFDRIDSAAVVVVGGGIAGLTAALGLAGPVVLVTKSPFGRGGSTEWAQGGMAAAVDPGDATALHAADTMAVGGGLNDPDAVHLLTRGGPAAVRSLLALGARLDQDGERLSLGREAGHSRNRIVHAFGDQTGAELLRTLTEAVRRSPNVQVVDGTFAEDLIVEAGRVTGLVATGPDGSRLVYRSPAVVLATGGIGRVYAHTTNPLEVTGDGLAMAARAGARLVDLEFVQFHPTALASGRDPMPLLTEALRGEGAVLVDDEGGRFMVDEHPDAELAPRDIVARAIWRRLAGGRKVYLDAREAVGESFPTRFPTVFAEAGEEGIDPRIDLLPVSPAAHYHMGGIAVDARGRSSLRGLWAAGETACTGVHGANRLASNSLLEAIVFGGRVAADIMQLDPSPPATRPPSVPAGSGEVTEEAGEAVAQVRRIMWEEVGLIRDEAGLLSALGRLETLELAATGGEGRNLALVARLVAGAAQARRESRGAHFRSDHPQPAPGEPYRLFWQGEAIVARRAGVA